MDSTIKHNLRTWALEHHQPPPNTPLVATALGENCPVCFRPSAYKLIDIDGKRICATCLLKRAKEKEER